MTEPRPPYSGTPTVAAPVAPASAPLLRRRTRVVALAVVIGLALFLLALRGQVDYVALGPGDAFNTIGSQTGSSAACQAQPQSASNCILAIGGSGTANPTTGALLLTTVSVSEKLSLGEAIRRWFDSSYSVVPYELEYPPSQSTQQTDTQNQQDMTNSQDDATTAALEVLGKPEIITITSFVKGSNADGPLKSKDVITAIDGKPVTGYLSLHQLVNSHKPGDTVTVTVSRNGKPVTASVKLIDEGDADHTPLLGIEAPSITSPIKVTISLQGVGGPSAGMMYALGIIDKLLPPDQQITGGKTIAGTGTIDPLGNVGDIGGIQEKLRGAKKLGATVFLVPAGNCAEAAAAHVGGLRLIKIPDTPTADGKSNLATAYSYLQRLKSGDTTLPSC